MVFNVVDVFPLELPILDFRFEIWNIQIRPIFRQAKYIKALDSWLINENLIIVCFEKTNCSVRKGHVEEILEVSLQ